MSMTEITLILVVALILFGPEDLPQIARGLGKIVYWARKTYHSFMNDIQQMIDEPTRELRFIQKEITETVEKPAAQINELTAGKPEVQPENPLEVLPRGIVQDQRLKTENTAKREI